MDLILRELILTPEDKASFLNGLIEGEAYWKLFAWKPGISYSQLIERQDNFKWGVNLPAGLVPYTTFYGFVGDVIVGRLSIRHKLNESLELYGGHIGYVVIDKYRRRGYATEMLRQALPICKDQLGMQRVLLICADDNVASSRVIQRCGGKLHSQIWNEELQKLTRRYWIELGE
jgi:predicted acetyltransferase